MIFPHQESRPATSTLFGLTW